MVLNKKHRSYNKILIKKTVNNMNYYYDFEFLEGAQTKKILGIPVGQTLPTIQPISVGIVAEDRREYYAIFNDFNLDEAWNRYDFKFSAKHQSGYEKEYWIRENVLKPIWEELCSKTIQDLFSKGFTYENLKKLINKYGKSRKQIAEEIKEFIYKPYITPFTSINLSNWTGLENELKLAINRNPINLYGYYSAYDHVVLCQLFGKMIDLPKSFPMYTIDLKQELDKYVYELLNFTKTISKVQKNITGDGIITSFDSILYEVKNRSNYPKQSNEHNALSDAKFNKELHEFLKKL